MLIPSSGSTTTFRASTTWSTVGAPPSRSSLWSSCVWVSSLMASMLLPGRGRLFFDLYLEGKLHYRTQRRGDRAVFLLGQLERFLRLRRVDPAARDICDRDPP